MNPVTFFSVAADLLAPQRCVLCGRPMIAVRAGNFPVCGFCVSQLHRLVEPRCESCGAPLISEHNRCLACRERPRSHSGHRSLYAYDHTTAELLRSYKGQGVRSLSRFFAAELFQLWMTQYPDTVVVPVPGHPSSRRKRGWDQSVQIARVMQRVWKVPVSNCLRRKPTERRQKELSFEQRQHNLEGRVYATAEDRALRGLSVTLVDDVYTTGATIECCAQLLLSAGVSRVFAVTIAMDL